MGPPNLILIIKIIKAPKPNYPHKVRVKTKQLFGDGAGEPKRPLFLCGSLFGF